MPEYRVKWADEACWVGVLGSLATVVGLVLLRAGVDAELTAAATGLVGTFGRLIIGALLPSPALPEP